MARANALRRGRRSKRRNLPADHVQSPDDDGEQVVEVVRNAAGELPDRFHLLGLTQQLFGLDACFVLDFEFAGALLDGVFERFGKGSELSERTLSFRYVDTDAYDAYRATVRVVKQVIARLHPSQFAVARAHDAKFTVHLPLPRGKRGIEQVGDPRHVLTEDALEPRFVTPVEPGQAVQRKEPG